VADLLLSVLGQPRDAYEQVCLLMLEMVGFPRGCAFIRLRDAETKQGLVRDQRPSSLIEGDQGLCP